VVFALLLTATAALAAKPSKVADLNGSAYVVRCNPEGTWVATWATSSKGGFTLWVVDTAKGDKREVDSSADPGGLCWIPGRNALYYCKGKEVNSKVGGKFTSVTYYLYDVAKNTSKKIPGAELKDQLNTYIIDPVAAEDGSKVFHMTIDRDLPSFNIYFPASNVISPMYVKAKVAADYDLSADGQTLYWPMTNSNNGHLTIAGWGFKQNYYNGLYEVKKDPATGRGGFKVDSTNKQAVTMATSSTDPSLKAVVYSYKDPKNPQAIPVKLNQSEEIVMLDWKGRSGLLYVVVVREQGGRALSSLIELNPATGGRTVILPDSTDEIRFVDYASRSGAYFYSAVVPGKGSRVVKVQ
jgi:hypothetical protein